MPELKSWPQGSVAVICGRVDDPYRRDVAGSVEQACYNCGETVMVSPASQRSIESQPCTVICVQCHAEYAEQAGRPTIILPQTPAQAIEQGKPVLDREEFVERYVATCVQYNGEDDMPELRQRAARLYENLENPAEQDEQWTIHSFSSRHVNFKHPDELGIGPPDEYGEPIVEDEELKAKLESGLAFFLSYYEHGNSIWFRKGDHRPGVEYRWDGVRIAGLLVWEHPEDHIGAKTYEERAKDADGFLKAYTSWANGEGYYFAIEDEDGEDVDSCGGFDDSDYMLDEIAPQLVGKEFEVEGDLRRKVKELEAKDEPKDDSFRIGLVRE